MYRSVKKYGLLVTLIFVSGEIFAQTNVSNAIFPKIKGYISILHTILTVDKNGGSFNFDKSYSVSFPIGLNLYKSDKIGFSFELAPAIKFENNTSKVATW